MEEKRKMPDAPIVFVTGIGQTWSSLKEKYSDRWNLFPRSSKLLFNDFKIKDYLNFGLFAAETGISFLTGRGLRHKRAGKAFSALMKYCIPDRNGKLSDDVKVRIYGPRSFDILRHTDFDSGEYIENCSDPLLNRIYIDIPCGRLSHIYGEENLYCFNYPSFSRLYQDADKLHEMIKGVIEDQKNKTGSDKVILVPMSMGATVVNAYLDKYGSGLVSKVISIVGAWNGSNALADLLVFKTAPDAKEKLGSLIGGKALEAANKVKKENLHKTLGIIIDAFVEAVLLKTTTFMALIPAERYAEVSKVLFTDERIKRNEFLDEIKSESEKYHNAQANIASRLRELKEKYGTDFYFISGHGLKFGDGSNDFNFLGMMKSSSQTDTDGVIQISSTTPGTKTDPDGNIDPDSAYFAEHSWYFEGQKHELGTNNTALRLAFDIALGEIDDISGKYPQFNKARDIKDLYKLIDKANEMLAGGNLDNEKSAAISSALENAEAMLDCINNDPEKDNRIIENLRKAVE